MLAGISEGHDCVNALFRFPPRFGSRGSFFVQSNPVVSHREEVMRFREFRRISAWKISIFAVFGSRRVNYSGTRILKAFYFFFLVTYRWSPRRSQRCRVPFADHAPLRNRDFPRPFVTLGISCRGSRRVNRAWIVLTQFEYPSTFSFCIGMQVDSMQRIIQRITSREDNNFALERIKILSKCILQYYNAKYNNFLREKETS